MEKDLTTFFAPPERSTYEELKEQTEKFKEIPSITDFMDAIPVFYLILNENRQVVYANEVTLKFVCKKNIEDVYGMRPGELLQCMYASTRKEGCGTTKYCRTCGAVKAILHSLDGDISVEDCTIAVDKSFDNLELRVWTRPYEYGGKDYCLFAVQDIHHETRRRALEKVFFHDVSNTLNSLTLSYELIPYTKADKLDELLKRIDEISNRLKNEIESQRELLAAESNELELAPSQFYAQDIIQESYQQHQLYAKKKNRKIIFQKSPENPMIQSDKVLMLRVVGNMLKNAIEGAGDNGICSLGYELHNDSVCFRVHNPGFIPDELQHQIFTRSFSTKGKDRGLGTYSMKLLGEKYLEGKISFESNKREGTTFYAEFPIVLK
jgi:histidine kinase/DNA gyrase B/HSP90-like ATPase